MDKLIRLRNYYRAHLEKAEEEYSIESEKNILSVKSCVLGERVLAFSRFIKSLDLILNNSCVKPLDSRSPEGQGCQAGVSRPNDSQNPTDEQP